MTPQRGGELLASKRDKDLQRYAAHAAVSVQATAFLTHITTSVSLYVTVTGAAWAVVSGNALGASSVTLLWLLSLHIVLSLGVALGLWGMSNNLIQRLNFARWLAVNYWQSIEKFGNAAWDGVPNDTSPSVTLEFDDWQGGWKTSMPRPIRRLDFWLRYRAPRWPSLRYQRLWAVLPVLAAIVSGSLFIEVEKERYARRDLCREAAAALAFPTADPIPREAFERARYVFDKAGCPITRIDPRRLQSSD